MARLSAHDKKWQAESYANSLAEAAAIRVDKARMAAAKKAAAVMVREQEVKARAMKSVARSKVSKRKKK